MKISKKLVSFMLALAMVVTAMAVQTVPVQAATEISFENVNKKSITIRAGGVYTFKTNYKASKLNYKTSNKSIVKSLGNGKIKAVKKGTAKVTVSLKNDATEKATVTVHVQSKPSSNCKITLSRVCESLVEETYNKKTKKSDYRIYIDTEHFGESKKNVAAQLSVSVKGMQPNCHEQWVGYYNNGNATKGCSLSIEILDKNDKYYVPYDIETMTKKDWWNIFIKNKLTNYKYPNLLEKYCKVTTENTTKYYKAIISLEGHVPYALVKDKDNDKTYFVQYFDNDKKGNRITSEKAKKNYVKVLKSFKLQNFTYDELGYRY